MAEINPSGSGKPAKSAGVKKSKKLSTRVDLTPMVDLGFLLITFFIFTTTMSQATSMKLVMPKDSGDSTRVPELSALTFLLAKNNRVFYFEGMLAANGANLKPSSFVDMRSVIIHRQQGLNSPKDLIVMIKPEKGSMYKNVVDALDEMTINSVKRYAMVDLSPSESALLETAERSIHP